MPGASRSRCGRATSATPSWPTIIDAAQARGRRRSRHDGLLPAGAGHPDQHAGEPRAVPVHAGRHRCRRGGRPGRTSWPTSCGRTRRCATSPRRRRKAACARMVDVDREKAGRLGVSMQAINDTLNDAFGQRQISTIYAQANQYRVILEARRNTSTTRPRCEALRTGATSPSQPLQSPQRAQHPTARDPVPATEHAGAARRPSPRIEPHHGAAGDRAPGAVPLGDHQLQPRARRGAERRGRRRSRRPSGRSACRPR